MSEGRTTVITTDAAAVPAAERRVATPHGRVFVRETPGQDPPVVLLHGYEDASLHLVPDAAHYPQLDRPEVVARLLTEPADA